ncbi:hypothetical protein Tco_0333652 [Tanacetum coccineum]
MDDEPMWAADRVVAPTPSPAITILETANEFAIKESVICLNIEIHKKKLSALWCFLYHYLEKQKSGLTNLTKEQLKTGMNTELLSSADSFPQLYSIDSSVKSEPSLKMKTKP